MVKKRSWRLIEFGRGAVSAGLIGSLLSVAAQELGSEELVMTATYPSPVGIYARLITTGGAGGLNTEFSRNGSNVIMVNNASNPGGKVGIGTANPAVGLDVSGKTDALRLPSGTSAQRPASPANGDIRYNSDLQKLETYNSWSASWNGLGGGAGAVSGSGIANMLAKWTGPTSLGTGLFWDDGNTLASVGQWSLPYNRFMLLGTNDTRLVIGAGQPTVWSWANGWIIPGDFSLIQENVSGSRIYVKPNGYVGINTANPYDTLTVNGGISAGGMVSAGGITSGYTVLNGITDTQWLRSQIDGGYQVGDASHRYSTMHSATFFGSYFAGPDVAERYVSDEELEPGTLVSWDTKALRITKATRSNLIRLAGVISSNPGITLSDLTGYRKEGFPVALLGRVPVKVSMENGPIHVGDPLTISSASGVAMKATDATIIVGKALEDFDGSVAESQGVYEHMIKPNTTPPPYKPSPAKHGTGTVMMLVGVGWHDAGTMLNAVKELKAENLALQKRLEALEKR